MATKPMFFINKADLFVLSYCINNINTLEVENSTKRPKQMLIQRKYGIGYFEITTIHRFRICKVYFDVSDQSRSEKLDLIGLP